MSDIIHSSKAAAETVALGKESARGASPGEVWALVGDLGAGKTHFVKGIVDAMGVKAPATSPTFTLVHEYTGGRLPVYHFDFYRLESAAEALDLGLDEYLDGDGLTVIEWADKFPEVLPPRASWFYFTHAAGDPAERNILRTGPAAR